MDWVYEYVKIIRYHLGGRELPHVDCWGAHRVIVRDRAGVLLPEYPGEQGPSIALHSRRPEETGWRRVPPGEERELDLVLMGTNAHPLLPSHCGTVVGPYWMVHVDERSGASVKPFRDGPFSRVHPTLRGRVLGVYRPEELECR